MKQLIIDLFGQYSPLVDNNQQIIKGISGIDFTWIFGMIIFCILLISIFKLIGVIIKNG